MPDVKKPVKEVAVYDGSSWDRYDIGAKAENVSLSNINIGTNVNSAFNTLIGSNTLTDNKIVITDNQQHITTSNVNSSLLGGLSDTTIIENQGTLDNNVIIKKLKQNGTNNIICPESKTSAIYMLDNETTLDNYLGTITGTIGNTDISSIGNGTITGAIGELNDNFNPLFKQYETVAPKNTDPAIQISPNTVAQNIIVDFSSFIPESEQVFFISNIVPMGAANGYAALRNFSFNSTDNTVTVSYINTSRTSTISLRVTVWVWTIKRSFLEKIQQT